MLVTHIYFLVVLARIARSVNIQPSTFTAPGTFPTSVFSKYYNTPTATSAQPQPVISDPVTVGSLLHRCLPRIDEYFSMKYIPSH
jgi:sphingomyelin phosphodiesterase